MRTSIKAAFLAATACYCLAACVAKIPKAAIAHDAKCYPSVEAAAVAGLREAIALSEKHEHAGFVAESSGSCFRFSAPITSRMQMSVDFAIPATVALRAVYHTHPNLGIKSESRFSRFDVVQAERLRIPSYLGSVVDGSVRVLKPGGAARDAEIVVRRVTFNK